MQTDDFIALGLVYLIIAVSLAVSLFLEKRGSKIDTRKIVHIGVGNFVFVWWMFSESWIMLVFFTIPFAIILFMAMLNNNVVSNSKIGDLSNKGHKSGLFLYAVSITILVAIFFDHWIAASIGVMAMTYGDGFGSIVGKRFGKHKTMHGKSLEGSIGVFVATAIMTVVIVVFYSFLATSGYYPAGEYTAIVPVWALAIIAGLVASILEMFCDGDYDNLIIPIATTVMMIALGL